MGLVVVWEEWEAREVSFHETQHDESLEESECRVHEVGSNALVEVQQR